MKVVAETFSQSVVASCSYYLFLSVGPRIIVLRVILYNS